MWARVMWLDISERAKNVKIFIFHMNVYERETWQRKILIIKWIERPIL